VTKEQLHKKLQKKLYQHCEIKVQLNPYTSVKRRRKKPKKLFISASTEVKTSLEICKFQGYGVFYFDLIWWSSHHTTGD
jgi:hypothetical protein